MNAREANVFLTKAALLDGRFRRTPEEQADMAVEWAEVLADVEIVTAVEALREHYRAEVRAITPADIIAALPPLRSASDAGNVTELRLAQERKGIAP